MYFFNPKRVQTKQVITPTDVSETLSDINELRVILSTMVTQDTLKQITRPEHGEALEVLNELKKNIEQAMAPESDEKLSLQSNL